VDALLTVRAPDGSKALLAIEVKRSVEPRDVARFVREVRARLPAADAIFLVAPYLSPRARELLRESNASYLDATGNVLLRLDRPAVFIAGEGAQRSPAREDRPLASLKGPAAGRVVRALCDFRPPYTARKLAARSKTPVASVVRVVDLLEREALLVRRPRGPVEEVDWRKLVMRWTQDYALMRSNAVEAFLEPRDLPALLAKLAARPFRYAVTASLAAGTKAQVAPAKLAVVYVDDAAAAAAHLRLKPAEVGANVLLAAPFNAVVYERGFTSGSVEYAAVTQVAADLLTSPGRGPAEGEALLDWMKDHEREWIVG
jgi:hypothetical protein